MVCFQLLGVSLLVLGLHVFVFFSALCIKICPFNSTDAQCLFVIDAQILLVDTVDVESVVENLRANDP
jgi:hypothetical protein